MNILVPEFSKVKTGLGSFLSGLGIVPIVVIGFLIVAILFFAGSGLTEGFQSWRANRQIENLQKEAATWKAEAEKERAEKEQYKGAAAAYKLEADAEKQILVELLNARPELQNKVNAAARKVEAIRNEPIRPIDSNIRERVNSVSADLERLYGDGR